AGLISGISGVPYCCTRSAAHSSTDLERTSSLRISSMRLRASCRCLSKKFRTSSPRFTIEVFQVSLRAGNRSYDPLRQQRLLCGRQLLAVIGAGEQVPVTIGGHLDRSVSEARLYDL